ncbi:unnamed protein product, partial [Thlaspi arvense]
RNYGRAREEVRNAAMSEADATVMEVEGGGEGETFEVGKTYAVTLFTGIEFNGIVLAYDSNPNFVIFHILSMLLAARNGTKPETGKSMTTRMVNAKFITKLKFLGKVKDPLASKKRLVDLDGLLAKEGDAIREIEKIGVGVTAEAQSIFDALSKSFAVHWENTDIVVMREVRVCSPYHHSDCVTGGTNAAKQRVKRAVTEGGEREVETQWHMRQLIERKSLVESEFFLDPYHSNPNWSILYGDHGSIHSGLEELKLDLPGNTSFASYFTQNKIKKIRVVACTDGLVLLRLEPDDDEDRMARYYVGNPMLRQLIQLPPPPSLPRRDLPRRYGFYDSGLVTRKHNSTLLGYKVVRVDGEALKLGLSQTWSFEIFSSDSGEWDVVKVSCPGDGVVMLSTYSPVSVNGKLHWLDHTGRIIVHDFFSRDDQVRAISLPARMQDNLWFPGALKVFAPLHAVRWSAPPRKDLLCLLMPGLMKDVNKSYTVRIWRLKCDSWSFEKAREINMACVGVGRSCVPVAINVFDVDIIYLWDFYSKCFLACNLRTNTKSYGARKVGTFVPDDRTIPDPFEDHRYGFVYKEDTLCFEPRFCLSQFVPSSQAVPT